MTQTWLADEAASGDRLTYEPVFCLACSQQHFICTETGRALGDRVEATTVTHGPAFPPEHGRGYGGRSVAQAQPESFGRTPVAATGDRAKAC
ncbi:hypothetical protein NML43_02810 [Rhodopseudomonas palustris]|uniref:hypothetical protein n=1 Tax=Rhodopseudomonas palustris TaxID=1076 RepID=UPI0020CEA1FE|nr:hypothetical protein [Rhodopseudomonas palustris]MCP9626015.1 hypothetical protein [Rhodopseudomonas palustris]